MNDICMNTLYLGDCLNVLRENIPDESVDLIYIDPPFNSKRDYNIFFDDKEIHSQRVAFEDTWTLKNIQDSLQELHTLPLEDLWALLIVYQKVAPHAFPYITMMALRLVELHRVLKQTGSFYLHCDSTMSHYLKTICDIVFQPGNFRNEICWKRATSGSSKSIAKRFGTDHDNIFFYTKSDKYTFNTIFLEYPEKEIEKRFKKSDERGRYKDAELATYSEETLERLKKENKLIVTTGGKLRYKIYLDDIKGVPSDDMWLDISPINSQADERLGYPTQKPKALLERIIRASSNEDDTVLDAFCGCGTTIDAAESLHRKWIGIDVSPIAISLMKRRMQHTYKKGLAKFEVRGIPTDEQSALKLAKENPFAFQDWWISEFEVFSSTYGTKGADQGVDGIGLYATDNKGGTMRVAYQVKGGENVQSKDIDALIGAMSKHKCELGIFLTLAKPTKPMLDAAAKSGFAKIPGFEYPKIQIVTLKDYFAGKRPKLPDTNITFKAAQHSGKQAKGQMDLEM
jgi:DNA modification methylase